jgi:hypothetical protein
VVDLAVAMGQEEDMVMETVKAVVDMAMEAVMDREAHLSNG